MRRRPILLAVAVLVAAALGLIGYQVWRVHALAELPPGIVQSNGRIEAERVDIATKYAARVAEVLVDEGEWVERGQVLARMDTTELEAELREAEAAVRQARQQLAAAEADIVQRQSQLAFAAQEHERAKLLFQKGNIAKELLDRRTNERNTAQAALAAAQAGQATATAAIEAAAARAERLRTVIEDHELKAPRSGRVEYRLAHPGEVLPAGGKVLTLLDLTDVYMTIFLPTGEAGRLAIGAEARIVLDAAPEYVIPAHVSFVASDAQFTPKQVETRSEREKLMFRVKVQIGRDLLERYARLVKTGLPGVAYVRIASGVAWPEWLQPRLPDAA
ncbi:HlyD family secretion protein [Benzoatithermus flavus]|uniref:HlyD family efflux transporter periplasmic adaptor subunit n=1 Tax=Benzoatithermus flavus TaxID=3108223 RepID=A0ABU8XVQ8_9PROT